MQQENPLNAWLGTLPSGWGQIKLKYIFNIKKDIVGEEGHTVLSVTQQGIVPKQMDAKGQFASDYSKYQIVHNGDFVMNHMDLLTGWVDISNYEGVTSPDYRVFYTNDEEKTCKEFYKYIFQLCYKYRIFYSLGKGVAGFGRWRLPADMFLNFVVPLPKYSEQVQIAKKLEKECNTIDELLAGAEESIKDYKKCKKSLIHEVVTQGLNKNTVYINTDVPWFKSIPSHWTISRIKNEFDNLDYLRMPISAENRENKLGLYDYYGASGVIDKIDDYNVDDKVLLIGEDGANLKMRNLPLVYKAEGRFWVNNHAHILKVKEKNDYDFMAYLLEAGDYTSYITGSAQPKLSQFNLMRFSLPIPPIQEQIEMRKYLNSRCIVMDAIIEEKEKLIKELENYKISLVYEYVTGKRRVV